MRRRIPSTCDILAVVKADAYGHGATTIAQALAGRGVGRFGVATLQEGILLRKAGLRGQILVMGPLLVDQYREAIAQRLTPIIFVSDSAQTLAQLLPPGSPPYGVHLKIDTGMGRLGLSSGDVLPLLDSPAFRGPLRAEGLMTHLADADNRDATYTTLQIDRFRQLAADIEASGRRIPFIHAANSSAILLHPSAHLTLVRPGLMLYGYQTGLSSESAADLKPVLSLSSRIVQIRSVHPHDSISYNRLFIASRPSRIAVLPIGYADGYFRSLSNRGAVLIRGRRAPVVGRVCMDMTMVDVTDIPHAAPGDEAVLIGTQDGDRISAADVADWAGTIPYEILCAIGPRVTRVYR